MELEPNIERTPDAKRLQIKSWACKDCGSRHSRAHDAKRHWLAKHEEKAKPAGKRK